MSIDDLLVNILKRNSKSIADKDVLPLNNDILFKKVAFDLYKVDNDPYYDLWTTRTLDDGNTVLVRASNPTETKRDIGDWTAVSDYDRKNITLNYKNAPIARFADTDYSFDRDNIIEFKEALLEKVSKDSEFVLDILNEQPESKKTALLLTFPEFNKSKES